MNEQKQEMHRVYQILTEQDQIKKLATSLYRNPFEKWSLGAVAGFAVAFFVLLPAEATRPAAGWALLFLALSFLVFVLASFITELKFFVTPTKSYLKNLTKKLLAEEELLSKLSRQPVQDLQAAKRRLEFERNRLRSRLGFLLGAVDTLGIAPAALALYVAYAKAVKEQLLPQHAEILIAFFIGLYIGGFLVKHVTERFTNMILLLEQAIEEAKALIRLEVSPNKGVEPTPLHGAAHA